MRAAGLLQNLVLFGQASDPTWMKALLLGGVVLALLGVFLAMVTLFVILMRRFSGGARRVCPACQGKFAGNAKFCPHCGGVLV